MAAGLKASFEHALCQLARERHFTPAPLALRVTNSKPLTVAGSDGLTVQVQVQHLNESLKKAFANSEGAAVLVRSWHLDIQYKDKKVQEIFLNADDIEIKRETASATFTDCLFRCLLHPSIELSSAALGYIARIDKRGARPLNAIYQNLNNFIAPVKAPAAPKKESNQTMNLPDRYLKLLDKFTTKVTRAQLFQTLQKYEYQTKRELRQLVLENDDSGSKRVYQRSTVLGLLSNIRK